MNKKFLYPFLGGFLFYLCCYLCFSIGQSHPKIKEEIKIRRDTIITRDTITIEKPKEKIRWKEKDKIVYVPISDTSIIIKEDTSYLVMQEERVEYEGEDYKATVSGIKPKLEEISVFPKEVHITEIQEKKIKKHWNFNISVGPGVIYNGKVNFGVGAIIGFGYSF